MTVEKKILKFSNTFQCENGFALKEAVMAYEEYGMKDGPVIVVTHGGLSSQHNAGKYKESDPQAGYWDDLIGPNKVLDTNRYRIISPNSLGSMYGTTSSLSINPQTNKPYGPHFPEITLIDMTRFLKLFLDELKIKKLHLIIGPSMGSLHALQLAALYPDFVNGVISIATAGRITPGALSIHNLIINMLKTDPAYEKGFYEPSRMKHALRLVHQVARIYYIHHSMLDQVLFKSIPDQKDAWKKRNDLIANYLTAGLDEHIQFSDPNCYITLLKALNTYDLGRDMESYEQGVSRIKCPVLLMNMKTDSEFPPEWADEVADILNKNCPNQAKSVVIESIWGHIGCLKETETLGKYINEFINRIKQ